MFNPRAALLFIFLVVCGCFVTAQTDTLNQRDSAGLKQGYWIFYGKDFPEKGYPEQGLVEAGFYVNDKRHGQWVLYHKDGFTPRTIGTFQNGRPAGPYKKFSHTGILLEEGTYLNGKQQGIHRAYYQNGCLRYEKFYNDAGKEEGISNYYYDRCEDTLYSKGVLKLTYEKINGVTVNNQFTYYPSACIREESYYDFNGNQVSVEFFADMNCFAKKDSAYFAENTGHVERFNPHGFNKVHDERDSLWLEGYFENGKFTSGKLYVYNVYGELSEVQIWKHGAFDTLEFSLWRESQVVFYKGAFFTAIDSSDIGDFTERKNTPFAFAGYMFWPADFDANGKNNVYNINEDLWLSGKFKDGYLQCGKQYFYDEESNELYAEIYWLGKKWRKKKPPKRKYT